MATGFQYFNSDDVGAPILTGQSGKMIALLDWVLVSKGGWSKEFTGTNLAVYRSDTGNRCRLRIDDTQAKFARARCYRNMTAISTGTNPFPNTAQVANHTFNSYGFIKSTSADTTPRRYWGIRTDRYFVIFVEMLNFATGGYVYRGFFGFGDFPPMTVGDSHNTVLLAAGGIDPSYHSATLNYISSPYFDSSMSFSEGNNTCCVSGNNSGSVTSPSAQLIRYSASARPVSGSSHFASGGTTIIQPLHIISGPTAASGTNEILFRGHLPNVSQMFGGISNLYHIDFPAYDLNPIVIGSKTYLPIMDSNSSEISAASSIGWLLEITDTDGAL